MAKKKQQTVYSFGSSYRCAREKREYTREQVAERANISPRFLSAIENDRRKPSLNVLIRLVLAIGASFDEILAPSAVPDEEVTDRITQIEQPCHKVDHISLCSTAEAEEIVLIQLQARMPVIVERAASHAVVAHFQPVVFGGLLDTDCRFDGSIDCHKKPSVHNILESTKHPQ